MLILVNVNESFAESTSFTVPPSNEKYVNIGMNEGDRIKFWITVSGGANDDINLRIEDYSQNPLLKQRIYSNYEDEIRSDEGGSIHFVFDNTISIISSKQVNFSYEIIQNPQSGGPYIYGGMLVLILIVIGIVGVVVGIKRRKARKQVHETKTSDKKIDHKVETEQNEMALNILKGRLARGDISKDEYDKLKKEFT